MQQQNVTTQTAPKNGATKQERPARATAAVTPSVDVYESASEVLVLVDLPGVKPSDLSLDLEKDALTLTATREVEGQAPVAYRRVFTVPVDYDAEGIEAKLEAGVLALKIPRKSSARPRQIAVKIG